MRKQEHQYEYTKLQVSRSVLKGSHPDTYVWQVTKSIPFLLKGGFLLLQNLK